jgi:hypothetical protein
MPVQKFRSVDDMNRAPLLRARHGDPESFFRQCARYWALTPKIYPRGVYRFRSVDEAHQARTRRQPVSLARP